MLPQRRTFLAGALGSTLGAALPGPVWAAQPAKKDPPKKLTAMIAAFDNYAHLDKLNFAVASALELAKELTRLKYDATFLTDADSVEKAKKALGGVAVEEVADAGALRGRVLKWLDDEAKPAAAQLALLVLTGHGCERDKKPWFLAAGDRAADGGVAIEEINLHAAKARAPLVVICDTCRTEVSAPKAPAAPAAGPRGRGADPPTGDPVSKAQNKAFAVSYGAARGPESKSRRPGQRLPPNLFSTTAGKKAADAEGDLIGNLAAGLKPGKRTQFAAHAVGGLTAADDESTLSLHAWFYSAITAVLRATGLQQAHELKADSPDDLLRPVARLDPKGAPQLPWLNPQQSVDLPPLWYPEHGDYQPTALHGGLRWQIDAPAAAPREPWASGYVAPQGTGFDTTGRALFFEYVLEHDAPAPRTVRFGLDAKFVNPPFADRLLLGTGRKWFCEKEPNKVQFEKVPLLPDQTLNYVGFSDLPKGKCRLKVRRLYLADAKLTEASQQKPATDLLPRCWFGETSPAADEVLPLEVTQGKFAAAQAKESAVFKIGKGTGPGWRGGPLAPPVWVRKGDRLDLEVENRGSEKMQVEIQLKEDFATLVKETVTLEPGKHKKSLAVTADGLANYFVVARPSSDLYLYGARVVAK